MGGVHLSVKMVQQFKDNASIRNKCKELVDCGFHRLQCVIERFTESEETCVSEPVLDGKRVHRKRKRKVHQRRPELLSS